jgi:RNA polymerase sigma-70 factor, ECF subfamily
LDALQLERIYRAEAPRITAALAARTGDVGLAADAVQDAFVEAIEHWRGGPPPNPGGWLATTARRKAIDRLRRARAGQEKLALLAVTETGPGAGHVAAPEPGAEADDELLGMIFACCHPTLPRESQIALTLRAACGLTTAEIAAAFLAGEPAMTQRLLRARKALRARSPAGWPRCWPWCTWSSTRATWPARAASPPGGTWPPRRWRWPGCCTG